MVDRVISYLIFPGVNRPPILAKSFRKDSIEQPTPFISKIDPLAPEATPTNQSLPEIQ
jgi:hypothetical protein